MLAATAVLVGCATQPPAPATEQVRIPDGYTKVIVNGQERYCRDDVDTGSRVRRIQVCYTANQLLAIQEDIDNGLRNQVQNRNSAGASSGMGMGR